MITLKISDTFLIGVVGADAYIGPRSLHLFTKIFGEFATSSWADVGIGPYRTPANSYCLTNPEHKALLPQTFKSNCSQTWETVTGGA